MIKKENKIYVVISTDTRVRRQIIAKLAVALGFAQIPSDAQKIIKDNIYDYDLGTSYFVMCSTYNFRDSPNTNHRIYEMAARGMAVIVGTRSLPREFEFISQTVFPEDFL